MAVPYGNRGDSFRAIFPVAVEQKLRQVWNTGSGQRLGELRRVAVVLF
jgi:hypothetical protein